MTVEQIFEAARIREAPERGYDLTYFEGINSNYPIGGAYFDLASEYGNRFNDFANWVINNMGYSGTLIDVGGSVGHLQHVLSQISPEIEVLYTDFCHDALKWGKDHYPNSSPIRLSAANLPFSDESVDGVLFADVIEHLQPSDAESALFESMRVLKTGGGIFIGVPNRRTWTKKNWGDPTHLWIPSAGEMRCALEHVGFDDISITTRGFPYNSRTRALLGKDLRLPVFGSSLLVHARKM